MEEEFEDLEVGVPDSIDSDDLSIGPPEPPSPYFSDLSTSAVRTVMRRPTTLSPIRETFGDEYYPRITAAPFNVRVWEWSIRECTEALDGETADDCKLRIARIVAKQKQCYRIFLLDCTNCGSQQTYSQLARRRLSLPAQLWPRDEVGRPNG